MIESNEVTIITGPTGCGKTTQVPQYILDYYAEQKMHCNIVVTQPRRIAAITIPERVCNERDWPLGTICGYKVRLQPERNQQNPMSHLWRMALPRLSTAKRQKAKGFSLKLKCILTLIFKNWGVVLIVLLCFSQVGLIDKTSEDTRLTYMTVGVFLQVLIATRDLNQFTHIILDEVHERDQSMDFALLVVKKLLNSVSTSRGVKVFSFHQTSKIAFLTAFPQFLKLKSIPNQNMNINK